MVRVDVIKQSFTELFTINFTHGAYLDLLHTHLANDITVIAEQKTANSFLNHEIGYKFYRNRFICFIRFKLSGGATQIPFVPVTSGLKWRFFLNAGNAFADQTVMTAPGANRVYYFSNRANAATNGFLSHDAAEVNDNDLQTLTAVELEPNQKSLGVIDIFSSGAVNNSYELFSGASQTLNSPVYRIDFKKKP